MGHLTSESALNIVAEAEAALSYKVENQITDLLVTEIPDRCIIDYNKLNEDSSNPNSALLVQFQIGPKKPELTARTRVLFNLLKEKVFNILRTQEQLGYIVSSDSFSLKKVEHGRIIVQSAIKDPEYLVH
eukprot:CAMPEP_0202973590 /NCGR_PEP_ID=MMETSP1396-20130829/51709_1 /ASSEMBLY_ACC=CAM_ASM_000872 /TAXON_ID= /ORGANISM="Pseudokeronopsis sp., Strain Brazil" /LENGTH=129 /DNA_ID=CAMNT_0049705915 /DNA_START=85 /DNA_END=471 /DNA_ORIENTATION=-